MMVMGEATVEDAEGGARKKKKTRGGKRNVPIGNTGDGALLKLHHVAGQSPSLVRENVFHLHQKKKDRVALISWMCI